MQSKTKHQQLALSDWLSYAEAAEELGLSPESVRRYALHGILERGYLHSHPLISRASVEKYKRYPNRKPRIR